MTSEDMWVPNTEPASTTEAERQNVSVPSATVNPQVQEDFGLAPPKEPPNVTVQAEKEVEAPAHVVEECELDRLYLRDGELLGLTVHVKRTGRKYLCTVPVRAEVDNTGF